MEDRRGMRVAGPVGGGLGLLAILVISALFGVDPTVLLEQTGGTSVQMEDGGTPGPQGGPPQDELGQFVSVVLADTEDTWHELFADLGRPYEEPSLVLFTGIVRSACGMAESAVGPFYCPMDGKVYIDLGFYRDLQQRFGAPGDFAQAYVVAHEVGHHVQMLLGTSDRVRQAQSQMSREEANALSVRLELQADCFAGVWAYHADRARALLEQGDIEEGLNAASAIGDDRLQRQTQGYVVPESFTHGSAEQRATWFARGLESGDPDACDTFRAREL